jgi:hypothetical protein
VATKICARKKYLFLQYNKETQLYNIAMQKSQQTSRPRKKNRRKLQLLDCVRSTVAPYNEWGNGECMQYLNGAWTVKWKDGIKSIFS